MTVRSSDLRAAAQLARDARGTERRIATVRRHPDNHGKPRSLLVSIVECDGRAPTLVVETQGRRCSRIELRDEAELAALEAGLAAARGQR